MTERHSLWDEEPTRPKQRARLDTPVDDPAELQRLLHHPRFRTLDHVHSQWVAYSLVPDSSPPSFRFGSGATPVTALRMSLKE